MPSREPSRPAAAPAGARQPLRLGARETKGLHGRDGVFARGTGGVGAFAVGVEAVVPPHDRHVVGSGTGVADSSLDRKSVRGEAQRLDAPEQGRLPPGGSEAIDPATAGTEATILGLRLDTGLPVAAADEPPFAALAGWATEAGLLERAGDRLRLTTRGRLLSNELFARLL